MTQNLHSSVPGIYQALLGLVQTAAAAQNPPVSVFAFEVGQYEPATYATVHAIRNHLWDPETIGTFSQLEHYDIVGCVSIFTGDSPNTNPSVATTILAQTWSMFETIVMTPVMSNRTIPILGTSGPSPYQVLPGFANYDAALGNVGGTPQGWVGNLEYSFHFDAYITPA